MEVLMLGWEYPPHIAGGLGTACAGLTKALASQGVAVRFIMPNVVGDESAEHMALMDVRGHAEAFGVHRTAGSKTSDISFEALPAFLQPYWSEEEYAAARETATGLIESVPRKGSLAEYGPLRGPQAQDSIHYSGDIYSEVARFTEGVVDVCARVEADVIHAHDWMTYPAAVALRKQTGKPLVTHVHSLEFDRSGRAVNPRIAAIEGMGLAEADAIIAVSHYTKCVICREHGIDPAKVHVVHNGIYEKQMVRHYQAKRPDWPEHVVLFLGRVTFQKGPDYFVRAAAKVIPHVPDALFVVAGDGDLLEPTKQLARDLGVDKHFRFPGFLRGTAVEEMFAVSDLYVMPSVSEPFGISALEAINFDVPVLISKQSGVAEVVSHSLKFDFWDVDRLADLIINGLVHDELRADMIDMARSELAKVRWDASASKVIETYKQLLR